MMLRTFTEAIHISTQELANEFWNMSAHDQIIALHAIQKLFFATPTDGKMELSFMSHALETHDKEFKEKVKYFVTQLYEYLCKEDK